MKSTFPETSMVPVHEGELEKWERLTAPIRRDLSRTYVTKTKKALDAGLHDAAVNYMWDLVVSDLRMKVEAYGVDIFSSVEEGIKYNEKGATLQDRWKDVQDYKLLSGCLQLNLISRTAYRHLSFWMSVRNHESAAHPVDEEEELDYPTAVSCIRDCVKYVLSREMPAPGFNLKLLSESLKKKDLSGNEEEMREQFKRLSAEQCGNALGMMVSMIIDGNPVTTRNVKKFIDVVWANASDVAKKKVGEKYAKLTVEGNTNGKESLFSLLVGLDGMGYVPEYLRLVIFKKAARELIEAHFEWQNFSNEIAPARQLAELGGECPEEALPLFCTAYLVSYLGNAYGTSNGALRYLDKMKEGFTHRHWKGMLDAVRKSDKVQSELASRNPFKRLQSLCEEMLPMLVTARDKRDCESIIKHGHDKFIEKYLAE